MQKDDYSFETGMNKNGDMVIVCSPKMYDRLIDEFRSLFDILDNIPENQISDKIKELASKYPATFMLSQSPKIIEKILKP